MVSIFLQSNTSQLLDRLHRDDVELYISHIIEKLIDRTHAADENDDSKAAMSMIDGYGVNIGIASRWSFLTKLGKSVMNLKRKPNKLELRAIVWYHINKSQTVYFYGSIEYLKSLTLKDLRHKLEDVIDFSYIFVHAEFTKKIASENDCIVNESLANNTVAWNLAELVPNMCKDQKEAFSELRDRINPEDIILCLIDFKSSAQYFYLASLSLFGFDYLVTEAHVFLRSVLDRPLDPSIDLELLDYMKSHTEIEGSELLDIDLTKISSEKHPTILADLQSYDLKLNEHTDELNYEQRLEKMTNIKSMGKLASALPYIISITDRYTTQSGTRHYTLRDSMNQYPSTFVLPGTSMAYKCRLAYRASTTQASHSILSSFNAGYPSESDNQILNVNDNVVYELQANVTNND